MVVVTSSAVVARIGFLARGILAMAFPTDAWNRCQSRYQGMTSLPTSRSEFATGRTGLLNTGNHASCAIGASWSSMLSCCKRPIGVCSTVIIISITILSTEHLEFKWVYDRVCLSGWAEDLCKHSWTSFHVEGRLSYKCWLRVSWEDADVRFARDHVLAIEHSVRVGTDQH